MSMSRALFGRIGLVWHDCLVAAQMEASLSLSLCPASTKPQSGLIFSFIPCVSSFRLCGLEIMRAAFLYQICMKIQHKCYLII